MPRIVIKVRGKEYPCSPTMGAHLRFRELTGKESTAIDPASFTDLCTFLYCCVASKSAAEGVEFPLTLLQFADAISPDDLAEWNQAVAGDAEETNADEKKSH